MANWGVNDIEELEWLDVPSKGFVEQAKNILELIGATEDGVITDHGKRIHQLPCHPRLAHLLINSQDEGLLGLGTDLCAILEEKDPMGREAGIDVTLRIEQLRKLRKEQRLEDDLVKLEE